METVYTKTYQTYQEYKTELDTELQRTAEGFVRIGYLLKVARDTNILEDSPYQTVTEFARAEYGIDKTMVSRFININDRFSENGYSDQLQDQYKGYGYAKLTLMLSLPDEINRELSPSYSKAEIQAIKDEVDEEKAISDLEVMMEPPAAPADAGTDRQQSLLDMLVRQLGEDSPELYVRMAGIMGLADLQEWTSNAGEILAPDGEKQYSIRISGTGRFMVSIRETEDTITVTALRTLEKTRHTYQELYDAWEKILPPSNGKPDTDRTEEQCRTSWELEYGREYPGKVKVAPVQQPAKPQKTKATPTPRKESKVQKAPKPTPAKPAEEKQPAPEPEKPESTGTGETEEQLPGQIGSEEAMAEAAGQAAGRTIQAPETEELPPQEKKTDPQEPEKPESTDTEQQAETTEKGATSYIELYLAAGQEPDTELDAEWEKQKKILLERLKQINDKNLISSGPLSTLYPPTIKLFRRELIDMAALIEKELLRRGEGF